MIKNLENSKAILDTVPISAVRLKKGFWSPRYEKNWRNGIPAFLTWLNRDDQTAPFPAYYRKRKVGDSSETQESLNVLKNNYY